MARRPLALLLGLLLILGIGAFALLRVVGKPPAESPAPALAPAATTAPPSPAPAELHAPATADAPPATADAIESTPANPSRERVDAADEIPADAIWIEGRVVTPAGAPTDEHVEVLASASRRAKPRHVPVAGDGTFRAPFPKGTEKATLDLGARFLYLPSPLEVAPSTRGPDAPRVVLEPKVGGCVRGHIVLPPNALDRRSQLGDCRVSLMVAGSDAFNFRDRLDRNASVDENLSFELGGVPDGARAMVHVRPKGFASASLEDVQVRAGRVTDVELRLQLGARVAGRVVDEHGAPVAGVRIGTSLATQGGHMRAAGLQKSGADGTFVLEGVEPGKLTLDAQGSGLALASLPVGELADGDVREGLEIVLPLGEPIRGRVQWPDGSAAEGCRIEYAGKDDDSDERRFRFGEEGPSCTAAADGTFEIVGLGKDAVQLTAKLRGPDTGPNAGQVGVARLEDVHPGTSGLVIVLQLGRSVRGRAVDDTGAPVAAFQAVAQPADGDRRPWEQDENSVRAPGKDGAFAIEGLPDGAWNVTAKAKGHATSAARRVVIPTDTEPFDLVLPRSATAAGTVVDPSGKPVAGAHVETVRRGNPFEFFSRPDDRSGAKTDAEGKFTIDDLEPGAQELVASAPELAESEPAALEVAPAQSVTDLVLALRRGGRIAGEVLDDAGRPDGTRWVNVHSQHPRVYRRASVDDAGRFDVPALPPGKYQIYAEPPQERLVAAAGSEEEEGFDFGAPKMAVADVVDGETTHVVLGGAPKSGIRVHGTITMGTGGGRPVARCTVFAGRDSLDEGSPRTASSDDQGRYELVVDGAGMYTLVVNDRKSGVSSVDRVDVPAGEEFAHDIVLPGGRIAGRVIGADGAPAAKLWVQLEPDVRTAELSSSASYGMKHTDEKGAFAFEGLKAGTYTFRTGGAFTGRSSQKNGMAVRSGITLADGGSIDDLEIRLEAAARIEGTVTGPDGKPVSGASILVRDETGAPLQIASNPTTDASGRFAVEGLPAAKVVVVARTKNLVSAESRPTGLKAGETARVELALRRGTVLRVLVQEKDGTPVLASVGVTDDQGRDVGYETWYEMGPDDVQPTAAAGQRIGPIPPGHYKVTATNHDLSSASVEVDASGDEQTVTLKFGG